MNPLEAVKHLVRIRDAHLDDRLAFQALTMAISHIVDAMNEHDFHTHDAEHAVTR